jgi:hypothetical protein
MLPQYEKKNTGQKILWSFFFGNSVYAYPDVDCRKPNGSLSGDGAPITITDRASRPAPDNSVFTRFACHGRSSLVLAPRKKNPPGRDATGGFSTCVGLWQITSG